MSSEGTAENFDFPDLSRPFGTWSRSEFTALKRRAILECSFGTSGGRRKHSHLGGGVFNLSCNLPVSRRRSQSSWPGVHPKSS
jgi:hypothetical protein